MTETRKTLPEAMAVLAALDTPHDVANYLEDEGITGWAGEAYACPVARYLQREVGHEDVGVSTICYFDRGYEPGYVAPADDFTAHRWSTPPVVVKFIEQFDEGNYRKLEEAEL